MYKNITVSTKLHSSTIIKTFKENEIPRVVNIMAHTRRAGSRKEKHGVILKVEARSNNGEINEIIRAS